MGFHINKYCLFIFENVHCISHIWKHFVAVWNKMVNVYSDFTMFRFLECVPRCSIQRLCVCVCFPPHSFAEHDKFNNNIGECFTFIIKNIFWFTFFFRFKSLLNRQHANLIPHKKWCTKRAEEFVIGLYKYAEQYELYWIVLWLMGSSFIWRSNQLLKCLRNYVKNLKIEHIR